MATTKKVEKGHKTKEEALEITLKSLEKAHGKGIVMRLGDKIEHAVETISTGSLLLDTALGVGGLPKGRITEIYGPESSGKTTLSLHVVAEMQKAGGIVAFIDVEHALDLNYAEKLGVNIGELLIAQPSTGEEALEIMDTLVHSGAIDMVVVDSVAALVPRAEIEGEMGGAHVGLQARLMSQALRKLTGSIHKFGTVAVFINQLREKVGVVYGSPEVTPGGNALKFYSSVRIDVRRGDVVKEGANAIGHKAKLKIVKNKVAPPFKVVQLDLLYGKGMSKEGELLDLAVERGIIEKAGSWFSYNNQKIGQGREHAKRYLQQRQETFEEVYSKVSESLATNLAEASFQDSREEWIVPLGTTVISEGEFF